MLRYILGPLGILIGVILVLKAEWFLKNFGRMEWAEKYLSTEGGTRLAYKLLGILIIIICFMIMTGFFQVLLLKILGPLFRGVGE